MHNHHDSFTLLQLPYGSEKILAPQSLEAPYSSTTVHDEPPFFNFCCCSITREFNIIVPPAEQSNAGEVNEAVASPPP